MPVPVGKKVISRCVDETFPYLDEVVAQVNPLTIKGADDHRGNLSLINL